MEGKPTVFIVNDDPESLRSLSWMLHQAGLQVRSFASGQEFLGAYRLGDAGCLVLDVRMPEMDGLALQQILRERIDWIADHLYYGLS